MQAFFVNITYVVGQHSHSNFETFGGRFEKENDLFTTKYFQDNAHCCNIIIKYYCYYSSDAEVALYKGYTQVYQGFHKNIGEAVYIN